MLTVLPFHAIAQAQPAAPAEARPLTDEQDNLLHAFVRSNPACVEMTNGCHVCVRSPTDAPKCSTPGIACAASAWQCKKKEN